MDYEVSFGRIKAAARATPGPMFRLALLGDFSGRASKGLLDTGDKLAARKPLKVDVDNLDDVLARLAPRILIPLGDEGTVEVPIASMDDFHPDQLVEALPLFEQLLDLRRSLTNKAGFDRAMKEVMSWAGAEPLARPESRKPRGGAIATDRKLSDFARLTGRPAVAEASADDLVRRLIGPYIVPTTDSRQDALLARVDTALSDAMRRVLHHPEFQSAEALWRGVEMLVRGLETGARLQIVLYDISAEELAADLASTDSLQDTALYSLLIEQPASDENAGPLSMLAGLYGFELAPPHADLLGRMAQLAAAAGSPFVAAIGPDALREPQHEWHPMIRSAWTALRELPASVYLALATPRFLLRMPYGKKTDPIDAFAFEEFSRQSGLSGMLWGNPAVLAALLTGQAWTKGGAKMQPGSLNVVGDLPVYVFTDSDGDQVALPCTERMFTERVAAQVASTGVIPVVSLRGRPEVRVSGFASVAGPTLAGRWAPVDVKPPAAPKPPAPPPPPPEAKAAPAPAPAPAPPSEEDMADLDALLAGLDTPEEAAPAEAEATSEPAPEPAAAADAAEDDLDALLASLSEEPPAAAADETEADLDALLASLK
jgi:type VI secretion system ImpB/VipA family protein